MSQNKSKAIHGKTRTTLNPSHGIRAAVKYLSHGSFLLDSRRIAQLSSMSFTERMTPPLSSMLV
jgi:hypothetical protein